MSRIDPSVEAFNQDVAANEGYLYTTNARLSSQLVVQRHRDVLLELNRFAGRSLLDIGCGDGTSTMHFWDHGNPRSITALDAASEAIAVANAAKGDRPIVFDVGDAHALPYPDQSFDVALLHAMLHHDDTPWTIIREAFRVAPEIIILEPNGYNVGLKVIERTSPYHRAHRERSYTPSRLDGWIRQAGGHVVERRFAGFVPIFSPDWLARMLKSIEPSVEGIPVAKSLACAIYVVVASRDG